jgi:hypothetical protein
LSHPDARAALNDVVPALETILSEMYSTRIVVEPLGKITSHLEDAGVIDPLPEADVEQREYVAHQAAA